MARKTPVPEEETAVAKRLALAREATRLTRTAAANKIGVSVDQLFNYESGRAPLPWTVGEEFCRQFSVSQRWLAFGILPRTLYATLAPALLERINPRESFYTNVAYMFNELSDFYSRHAERVGVPSEKLDGVDPHRLGYIGAAGSGPWVGLVSSVASVLKPHAHGCPPELHQAFFDHLLASMVQFRKAHHDKFQKYAESRTEFDDLH